MRRNMPPGFVAPYDAYEARYADATKALACSLLGLQDRGGDLGAALDAARDCLHGGDGPDLVEQGRHDDTPGARTHVLLAYWRDAARHRRWLDGAEVARWLGQARSAPLVGRYVESVLVPPRSLDTLIADPGRHWGLAQLADAVEVTPYHGYWGGTRDRIAQSAQDPLQNPDGPQLPRPAAPPAGLGEVVDATMPANAVFARGGPDWSRCETDELREFRDSVYPAYVRGARYLVAAPDEAGCYAACLLQETDAQGREVPRAHLLAWFVELSHLERWTRLHPTHQDIHGRFLRLIRRVGGMPKTNLYHEVTVVPAGGMTATYVDCLPGTGLLRFGTARA